MAGNPAVDRCSVCLRVGDAVGDGRADDDAEVESRFAPHVRGVGAAGVADGAPDVMVDRLRSPRPPSCRLAVAGGAVMLDNVGFGIRLSMRRRTETLVLGSASTSSVPNR
jgi:hypothetical protein